MAQLGLAVAGGVIGGQFGQAGLGFAAGSLLGSFLFAPTTKGPRVDDLKVQTASYGIPIPVGYGTPRTRGIIIWATDLEEVKHKQSAKGGLGPQHVSYTYKCNLDVLISQRQASGIIRIYADGKLLYDARGTSADPSLKFNRDLNFRFYDGSDSQGVDPLEEAIEGLGEVPNYLGVSRVVIEDFFVTDFGNRIPNLEFEVSYVSTFDFPVDDITITTGGIDNFPNQDAIILDPLRPHLYVISSTRLSKVDITNGQEIASGSAPENISEKSTVDFQGRIWIQRGSNNAEIVRVLDSTTFSELYTVTNFSGSGFAAGLSLNSVRLPGLSQKYRDVILGTSTFFTSNKVYMMSQRAVNVSDSTKLMYHGEIGDLPSTPSMSTVDRDGFIWLVCPGPSNSDSYLVKIVWSLSPNGDFITYPGSDMIINGHPTVYDLSAYSNSTPLLTYLEDDHSLIVNGNQNSPDINLIKFDIDSESVTQTTSLNFSASTHSKGSWMFGPRGGRMVIGDGVGGQLVNLTDLSVLESYTWDDFGSGGSGRRGYIWDPNSGSVFFVINNTSSPNELKRYYLDRLSGLGESLSDVVTDITERTGRLTSSDIDVTGLSSDTVRSYNLGRQMNGQDALEPLMKGFFFDAVETDWVIKFVKRGQASSFSIDHEDLGINGSSRKEERFIFDHEIPQKLNLVFIDESNDHEKNVAYSQRSTDAVESRLNESMQLPIGFTPDEAKRIIERWLYSLWNERQILNITTFTKHLRIDPGDVGTVTVDSVGFTVRVRSATLGKSNAVALDLIAEDAEVYEASITGYGGEGVNDKTVSLPSATDLQLIDSTLLRDQDDAQGLAATFYTASLSYDSNSWNGAVIFKSSDDVDFEEILVSLIMPTWGVATTQLNESSAWASWDRSNTLTVKLFNGSLESKTETQTLNGSNAALLKSASGWEVIQFADATDLGNDTYTLSNLLRGRRGSDPFQSDHNISDTFILLDSTTIKKYSPPTSEINNERFYKAVSIGRVFDSTPSIGLTLEGNSLKPWTPGHIKGSRDGSNNLTITWQRRTRVSGSWKDLVGSVPLGEASEEYEIDILDGGGNVVRTISSIASETTTYSAANQTSDGLTPGDPVTLVIYQISEVVGRGFGAQETV